MSAWLGAGRTWLRYDIEGPSKPSEHANDVGGARLAMLLEATN
jgi:hypothetical protein